MTVKASLGFFYNVQLAYKVDWLPQKFNILKGCCVVVAIVFCQDTSSKVRSAPVRQVHRCRRERTSADRSAAEKEEFCGEKRTAAEREPSPLRNPRPEGISTTEIYLFAINIFNYSPWRFISSVPVDRITIQEPPLSMSESMLTNSAKRPIYTVAPPNQL